MNDTDIKIGSIWVRDSKKYTVRYLGNFKMPGYGIIKNVVYAQIQDFMGKSYVGFQSDFLKDFTPYKPIYKYQYAFKFHSSSGVYDQVTKHITDEAAAELMSAYPNACHVKIEESKIEL